MRVEYVGFMVVLCQICVPIGAVLGAWVTVRGNLGAKRVENLHQIQDEIRADLREDLKETEAKLALLIDQNMQMQRRLDRVTDNLVRFSRNVVRLSKLVKTLLPARYRAMAEDVEAEARCICHIVGERLDDGPVPEAEPPPAIEAGEEECRPPFFVPAARDPSSTAT